MKSLEFIVEAEQNFKENKVKQYLDLLSDEDLNRILSLLSGSLEEGVQDYAAQKKAGKRIEGRPSDFIAYDDANQTAKRYFETNKGLEITNARYSPPPKGYSTSVPTNMIIQPEVKSFVASLDNKEKEALLNVVKKETKKRKTEPKKTIPKNQRSGKIISNILAGILSLGIISAIPAGIGYSVYQSIKTDQMIDKVNAYVTDWNRSGFDLVMMVDFVIYNHNSFPIKDFEIQCLGYGSSGTKIDSNTRRIHDIIPAAGKKEYNDFNMGFLNSQVKSISCKVVDAEQLN